MRNRLLLLRNRVGKYEYLAWVTGFVLMSYELVASRLLAPILGSSIYVWTSVIGVVILAMAVGYAVGGWLADTRSRPRDVMMLLVLAGVFVVLTGVLHGYVLHGISRWSVDMRLQALIAALVLFTPASFTLAVISPYLARLRTTSLQRTGTSVAGLSAANAIGGIMGTFCTGFWFFGFVGSVQALLFLSVLLVASSFVISLHDIRGLRMGWLLLAWFVPMPRPAMGAPVAAWVDTPTASYVITTPHIGAQTARVLMSGPGGYQSGVYAEGANDLVFNYTKTLANIASITPTPQRILILGGGTFTLAEYFGRHYPDAQVDVVELDPGLVGVAERYFRFDQPNNVHIVTDDARHFVERGRQYSYDFAVVDVYNDITVPFALVTTEFTESLARVLTPEGVVAVNMIGGKNNACMDQLAGVHGSYASTFSQSLLIPMVEPSLVRRQNLLALYANHSLGAYRSIAFAQDASVPKGEELTDNYAPIERLTNRCGRSAGA